MAGWAVRYFLPVLKLAYWNFNRKTWLGYSQLGDCVSIMIFCVGNAQPCTPLYLQCSMQMLCIFYPLTVKNASNSHIFIDDSKTWREAQDHCRGTYTDLASIRSREENHHIQNMSLSQSMWIGLFKDPWKWSDGSNSSYRFWKTNQPNNFRGDQNCTSVILNDKKWNDQWCNISWWFVCHGGEFGSFLLGGIQILTCSNF